MTGFLLRWAVAFFLLAATFNPTRWNYIRWVEANFSEQMPLAVLFGLLLFVGYIIYLRATLRSIGSFGMFLVLAIVGALIWVLYDYELLSLTQTSDMVWLALIALSLVLGIGLSWSHVRRWLSGQSDVDDIDE
jgi:cell division protein FtsW (lipid II flippase)